MNNIQIAPPLLIEDRHWRAAINDLEKLIRRAYLLTKRHGGVDIFAPTRCLPTVTLSYNYRVKQLNARFRGKNKPTNVLTFEPISHFDGGDIILAYGVVAKEARDAKKTLRAHLTHLLIHGFLHLAGHDHHQAGEARRMENCETRILRSLGYADPWKQGGRAFSQQG